MAAQPTKDDVDTFLSLVEHMVTRDVAIRRLKVCNITKLHAYKADIKQGNNNNVEQAINEYFEDSGSTSKVWKERAILYG